MIFRAQYDIGDEVVVVTNIGKKYGKIRTIRIAKDKVGAYKIKYDIQLKGNFWMSAFEYQVSKIGVDLISELQSSG